MVLSMELFTFLPETWATSYWPCGATTCPVLLHVQWRLRDVCRSGMTDTQQGSYVLLLNCILTAAKAVARVINKL